MRSDPPALAAHGRDHREPLDLDPVSTLPPDEAPSPTWLPALGAAMALVVLAGWIVRSPAEQSADADPGPARAGTARPTPSAAPALSGVPRLPAERRGAQGTRRERSPEEIEKVRELRRRFDEQRAR